MSGFVEYLKEVFLDFGTIQPRKMFGGYGIYHQGVMFGLVADDTLYLKVDDKLKPLFEAKGLAPFQYDKTDKVVELSYYVAPDEILDDPQEAALWAQRSYDVAIQAKSSTERNSSKGKKVSSKR